MDTFKQMLADGGWLGRVGTKHMFKVFGGEDKCLIRFLRAYRCDFLLIFRRFFDWFLTVLR